ncbi:pduQ protein [Secundilactobacillus kimchicus JCM 15530]|uniref:PduQ protein n=1 Tax=Secundilactobacillus kimchicus JCM 15530 TaxID=1302272 RepID=A0A0R1HUZ4_9LACO|nr:1-propanol dehydrogenase PduQ [Secundilactobacillus kimchicus]KRK47250.1 pduQ protein [Secundilactobacillus kimchicus JCM 15530]
METISIPTKILSGVDSLDELTNISNEKIFMVCDSFLPNTPTLKEITSKINSSNSVTIFSDVKPDPPLENIILGVKKYLNFQPTVVIAVGGGSAIDTGKAIRFFGEKILQKDIKFFTAIPTTSGTGSEVTNTSVISDTANHRKFPIMNDHLTPDYALLDPKLVTTAPQSVTAYSGLDVMTHALESLVATKSNLLTDALAEKAVDTIAHHLVDCYNDGQDIQSRQVVHEASCAAGIAFNTAGLGICHAIAHQLGAEFHVPHGLANAMLLPYVVTYNASKSDLALAKYAAAARKAGLASNGMGDKVAVRRLVACIQSMMRQMHCPATLNAFGIDVAEAAKMTAQIVSGAKADGTFPGNPVVPTDDDLAAIYKSIIK